MAFQWRFNQIYPLYSRGVLLCYNMPALYEEALFALVCYILPES